MKKGKAILILLFVFGAVGHSQTKSLKGTFIGTEQGDYIHFLIKTREGEESFFMNLKSPSVNEVAGKPEKFIGKQCTIKYIETKQYFREGGGVFDIRLLEEVAWEK